MKRIKNAIAYILLAVVLIGSGCIGTVSEHLTPGRCDSDVIDYVVEAGVGEADDYKGFLYPSLAELKRLSTDLDAAIAITNQELVHLAEQKQLQAKILKGVVANDVEISVAREEFIFNPTTGALAIGLTLLGVGASGYLGLMRKRPQDITPVEMEKALGEVKGEVTNKDRQLIQLVASVKNVIEAQPDKAAQDEMKKLLKAGQLPECRAAVKQALAQL
ncbi:hypothetical protein KAR91_01680 [Candidatus Pacearchaeota archaeon]|nr:hypothetical protein [Candidatus Pacearchaeota archaeon]